MHDNLDPGSPVRKTVKVEFLLPEKIRDGEGMKIRYIKSGIEKTVVKEGGATTLKAPLRVCGWGTRLAGWNVGTISAFSP